MRFRDINFRKFLSQNQAKQYVTYRSFSLKILALKSKNR